MTYNFGDQAARQLARQVPVLRGFSHNAKQDSSERSEIKDKESEASRSEARSAERCRFKKKDIPFGMSFLFIFSLGKYDNVGRKRT